MWRTLLYFFLPLSAFALTTPKPVKIRGSTKPLDYFDPLALSDTKERLTFFREAELKHGRIAMVSSLVIPILDKIDDNMLGIHGFDHLPTNIKTSVIGSMFISEFTSMIYGWENPIEKPFTLKYFYQPGDLGFQTPIQTSEDEYDSLMDKELNNGRLAMIGTVGMIVQQLVTQQHLYM
jgi:hypothetical protein